MYQSQFTNDQMQQTYRTAREQKVVLAPLMAGELMLTSEPTLSESGELAFKGRYRPVQGQVLVVDTHYAFSQDRWRLSGLTFEIDKQGD